MTLIKWKINSQDTFTEYEELFTGAFGKWIPHRLPDVVYQIIKKDKIGWASGWERKPGEILLQYGGTPKSQHGWPGNLKGYSELIDYIHADGYPSIMSDVENDNIPMLKMALSTGFKVIGARVASNGTVIVEIIKIKGGKK